MTCLLLLISQFSFLHTQGASLQTAPDVPWSAPNAAAINNLGAASGSDRNYECTPLTYRVIDDPAKTMQQGCFVSAAFGMLEPSQGMVIFNGTDEAEPIRMGGNPAALNVLPFSTTVARFGGFPVQGSYMYLYTYFARALTETHDWHFQRYKELSSSYDMVLSDSTGQPLSINNGAMAYSSRGEWLVIESPSRSLLRINLATFEILPFAPSFSVAGKPYAYHQASMAITQDGRYVAVASNEFSTFKVYDLKHCTASNTTDVLHPESCESHDYWPFVKNQIAGNLTGITHLKFINDSLLSFEATNGTGTDSYELSPSGPITSLISYLGLGDSYASGQGAYNYLPATDSTRNNCHLSSHSYPLRLNADVFSSSGHSVACSGATISDIGNQSVDYTGQTTDQRSVKSREADGSEATILHDFTPGYLSQQSFVNAYQPGVMTVQIGGNDIGFKDMLLRCVGPGSCYTSYEDRLEVEQTINRAYKKWVALYRQLQETAPASRIYAIGYPQIVSTAGKCGLNVHLDAADIAFARGVVAYLNRVITKAAAAAGVSYVDISDALASHQLCDGSSQPAMNGLTAGNDVYGILGQESYHPTAFGHELMEQAILQATHHFANQPKPTPDRTTNSPETSANDSLLQAPKSGRPIVTVTPSSHITSHTVLRGSSTSISVSGNELGLQLNTSYTVQLGGVTVGTATSDGSGNISTDVNVPSNTPPGNQPIAITGPNQNGDTTTITQPVYVEDSKADSDGDGILNTNDSCPGITNSGVDADTDNVDDACDTTIESGNSNGTTPTNSPSLQNNKTSAAAITVALGSAESIVTGRAQSPIATNTKKLTVNSGGRAVTENPLRVAALKTKTLIPPGSPKHEVRHVPLSTFWWYVWFALLLAIILLVQGASYQLRRYSHTPLFFKAIIQEAN